MPMIELMAIPGWDTPPHTVDDWAKALGDAAPGHTVGRQSEPSEGTWLQLGALDLRGLVVMEEGAAAAVHFELTAGDPAPATAVIEEAARALGWDVYADDDDDDDDD